MHCGDRKRKRVSSPLAQYAAAWQGAARTGKVCFNCGLEGHYADVCAYPRGTRANAAAADAHCLLCSLGPTEPGLVTEHSTTDCPHRPKYPWRPKGSAAPKRYSRVYRGGEPTGPVKRFSLQEGWASTTLQTDGKGQRMAPVEPPPEVLGFYLDLRDAIQRAKRSRLTKAQREE